MTYMDIATGTRAIKDPKLFRQQAYVDGSWIDADSGGTIPVDNPATGDVVGTVPKMGASETRRAIAAAEAALPAWRAKTAKERAQILRRWFDLMMANRGGSGFLHRYDEWSFCLMAARMAAEQERQ